MRSGPCLKPLPTMNSFPEKRKGLAESLASALCSTAIYLSYEKLGGIKAGTLFFFALLIAAFFVYNLFPTLILLYLIIIGGIVGQIAHFLICKRIGLGDFLLETVLRFAGMAVGWWVSYAFIGLDTFSSIFPIAFGPFVGDGIYVLYRKWFRRA